MNTSSPPNQNQPASDQTQQTQTQQPDQQADYVNTYQPPAQGDAAADTKDRQEAPQAGQTQTEPAVDSHQPKTQIEPAAEQSQASQPAQTETKQPSIEPPPAKSAKQEEEAQTPEQEQAPGQMQTQENVQAPTDSQQPDLEQPQEETQSAAVSDKPVDQTQAESKSASNRELEETEADNSKTVEEEGDSTADPEKLVEQNIFMLLGVEQGSEEEKDKFLNELQQVIWEDFLENDLDLLTTSSEYQQVEEILKKEQMSDLEKQEEIIVYLDDIVPDLEQILMEKALDLKRQLVEERIASMKEYYSENKQILEQIKRASELFAQGKWQSGAEVLNQISAGSEN